MSSTSITTVQAIAEMLGVSFSKPILTQNLAQEAEDLITHYIRAASVLAINSRSLRLSAQHINRILLSENSLNRIINSPSSQRLYGYEFSPFGQYLSIPFEQSELYLPRENDVKCRDIIKNEIPPISVNQKYNFQFLLAEGIYSDKKNLSNRRLIVKTPKMIERTQSAPISQYQFNQQSSEFFKRAPIIISKLNFTQIPFVHEVLNNSLQLYYSTKLNAIRDNNPAMREIELANIESDIGLQQLLPYFLQYIIYNMTIHYQNVDLMINLVKLTKSLVNNPSLCSNTYAHTFLRIIISALIGADYTSRLHGDDTKLRDLSASVLKLIVDKYQSSFQDMKIAVFNLLVSTFFDPNASIMAHYGAICGIEAIDEDALKYTIPHLKHYLKLMDVEKQSLNPRQRQCAQLICCKVKQLIDKYI